jgi:UDP-GlcNAc3NAcA epimerase
MNIMTVVGARPQFIKAALVSRELARRDIGELVVHTGQHYDYEMSQVFFDELEMAAPFRSLGVGSGTHAQQTAGILLALEPIVVECMPDWVLVYGDTNSTLAGALVAAKLNVPLAHVEAGLRSFDRAMPEEVNRVVADHLANLLLAPSESAALQLTAEGVRGDIVLAGDVMIDLVRDTARLPHDDALLERFGVEPGAYAVLTVHRAATADDPAAVRRILEAVSRLPFPVVFPVHPRTAAQLPSELAEKAKNVRFSAPVSYRSMVTLVASARLVLTDSGGLQKEAAALRVPCVTLRENTEWMETVRSGWNRLAGTDPLEIIRLAQLPPPSAPAPYDDAPGGCAGRIVDALTAQRPHGHDLSLAGSSGSSAS